MQNIYVEKTVLKTIHCDMCLTWRPSAILETMQETAGVHSNLFGLDRATMDAWGVAWVLSRLKVEFTRVPVSGETITVETWPEPMRHMFYPRSHVFLDEAGNKVGRAHSLWVVMDMESRRIVKGDQVSERIRINSDRAPALGMPATVRALPGTAAVNTLVPQFTDLDVNVHVNNTKYLDWCANALGMEIMQERCIAAFDVNYDAEIRCGTDIRTELTMDGDRFSFLGFSGNKRHFGVTGRLAPRR